MARRQILLILILFVTTAFVPGQNLSSASVDPQSTPDDWVSFASKEYGFSASFPSKPLEAIEKAKETTSHVFSAGARANYYAIKYTKYRDKVEDPKSVDELLTSMRSQVVGNSGGRLTDEKAVELNGFQGRELKIVAAQSILTMRLYWVKERLYQLTVVVPATATNQENTTKFLGSFSLSEKANRPATLGSKENSNILPDQGETQKLSEGVIKGKALRLEAPEYPRTMNGHRIDQKIIVDIVINEKGKVISAVARDGHPDLKAAAEAAAKASLFAPTLFGGVAVKVSGRLTYNFRAH